MFVSWNNGRKYFKNLISEQHARKSGSKISKKLKTTFWSNQALKWSKTSIIVFYGSENGGIGTKTKFLPCSAAELQAFFKALLGTP